jgi:hypothetical protein
MPMRDGQWWRAWTIGVAWAVGCASSLAPPAAQVLRAGDAAPGDVIAFDQWFLPDTMRVDYFHSGNATEDRIALDRVLRDGGWAGRRTRLTETLALGLYQLQVHDQQSGRLLFAAGFCGVFGEWQTTAPAKTQWGTFHASLRFPWPRRSVDVSIQRRSEGTWRELWRTSIDPDSRFAQRFDAPTDAHVWVVQEHGAPADKLDLVFLGDGYTAEESEKFHRDVQRMTEIVFSVEPWRSRRHDCNVRAIDVVSPESGVTRPHAHAFVRTALGCQFSAFDLERYALLFDNRALRDIAAAAPYDNLVVVLNSPHYGGGGIYNDQMTVAADTPFADYILVHELGHHVAGLGDEYYVAPVAYETGLTPRVEPWEPNLSALLAPQGVKWQDLVTPGTPVPTPWGKEAYEAAARESQRRREETLAAHGDGAEFAAVLREERATLTRLLAANQFAGHVGAFEGAGYETQGLYRPAIDCLMFSRNDMKYCAVCRRAIEQVLDLQTGR